MAHSIWVPLLVLCTALRGSAPRHVVQDQVSVRRHLPLDIWSKLPINLPHGIDPKNINATFIDINTCPGLKEELTSVKSQLQEKTRRNAELDEEAFILRRDARVLKVKLSTCSTAASAITDSYQIQLQNQMKELMEILDGDSFQIMQITSLNREVAVLEGKIQHGSNYSQSELAELQAELQEKIKDLNEKMQQFKGNHGQSELILRIIALQNDIWKLEQEEARAGQADLKQSRNMTVLQTELGGLLFQLRGQDNSSSAVLELISVQTKISMIQKLINIHIKKTKRINDDYERQRRQKFELLKRKIALLNRDEGNTELTNEILALQQELMNLLTWKSGTVAAEAQLKVLRVTLEVEKKRQEQIQRKLEETNYAQSQMLMKIINMMEELRGLQALQKVDARKTSTSQSTLQIVLQTKERELAKAQERIEELEREMQKKITESAGLQEKYSQAKGEFEQGLAELHINGDAKEALVLNVMNLHNELRNLRELISSTDDAQKKAELQGKLEGKKEELRSLTAELEKSLSNPKLIVSIIQLQNEIIDLQKDRSDGHADQKLIGLDSRLDGLIGEIAGEEILKHMLKIMALQNQVQQLREMELQPNITKKELTQLENELNEKQAELQRAVSALESTDDTNSRLILQLIDLNRQMKEMQEEERSKGEAGRKTINKLRQELQRYEEQHRRDQDEITALKNRLDQMETECSNYQQQVTDLQSELDAKMKELQTGTDPITSLIIEIFTLNLQQEELERQLKNTKSAAKNAELKKQLEKTIQQITSKTEELKAKSPNPQQYLQIISIQTIIEKQSSTAANESDYNRIIAFQDHLNSLISGIRGENTEVTKQALMIFTAQQEVARLQKLKESETKALLEKIKGLEVELEETRNMIREKTLQLTTSGTTITNLSAEIMDLHKKIKPLEADIAYLKETHEENLREVQERLSLTKTQLKESERQLKETDAKTFTLLNQMADLRTQLKNAKRAASIATSRNINELEQSLATQERENKKLEMSNKELNRQITELNQCCNDNSAHCGDLETQLQQSHNDAMIMEKQLQEQASKLRQVEQELENEKKNSAKQDQVQELQAQIEERENFAQTLAKQVEHRDGLLTQMSERMDKCTSEKRALADSNTALQNEKKLYEKLAEDLQNKLSAVDNKTIHGKTFEFDPYTAHPRIKLSQDRKQITTVDQPMQVHDHPKRFDVILAVLGKTGFTSGRNYWEVSLSDKNCFHLGMVSESAPRKGTTPFSPSKGYWTIVMTKSGVYRALDVIPVKIEVAVKPLTVGILLDYSEGQISFYNAGSRKHLYTFQQQQFTETMYPFINFCVEPSEAPNPITLVTPGSLDWLKSA